MSNRQLEDAQEQRHYEWVAAQVGLTVDELEEIGFTVDEDVLNDGTVAGLLVTFDEGGDPDILGRVQGLAGRSVRILATPDEPDWEDLVG